MGKRSISDALDDGPRFVTRGRRLNLLWIKSGLLHPVDFGGRIRSFQILKQLATRHRITYMGLDEFGSAARDEAGAAAYAHETIVMPHAKHPPFTPGFCLDLLRNIGSPLPYFVMVYRSKATTRAIVEMTSERRFDLIVCDFVAAAVNLPFPLSSPVLLFAHNVEATIWRRLADIQGDPIRRAYLMHQWRKTRKFERRMTPRFDQVVTVSHEESDIYRSEYGARHVETLPTGVDINAFARRAGDPVAAHHLVFTGAMDWLPNHDAMIHFIRHIFPRIRASLPDATLTIVGRGPFAELFRLAHGDSGIEVTGRVDDVRPHLAKAAAVVVPLRVGAGTRLKIFEAMAMEKPVVSTTLGAEGLPVTAGVELLLADSPRDFADAVIRVLTDSALADSLTSRAVARVRRDHGWSAVAERFEAICEVARDRRAAGPGISSARSESDPGSSSRDWT